MVAPLSLTVLFLCVHGVAWIGAVRRQWNDQALRTASVLFGLYFLPCIWFGSLASLVTPLSLGAFAAYGLAFHRPLHTGYRLLEARYHQRRDAFMAARLRARQRAHAAQQQRVFDRHARAYAPSTEAVLAAERSLVEAFREIGIATEPTAAGRCRAIIANAADPRRDIKAELDGLERQIRHDVNGIRQAHAEYQRLLALLREAKEAVLRNRSTTLLGDLDAIAARLDGEVVAEVFANRQWDDAREAFAIMSERLVMLRDTARGTAPRQPWSGGGDRRGAAPKRLESLQDAYDALEVGSDWPMDAIEAQVKARRLRHHPDRAKSEADRKERTQKMATVNAAWDIVRAKRRNE